MAATPKRKLSSARQGKRRSQIKLASVKTIKCAQCGATKLSHYTCKSCGK